MKVGPNKLPNEMRRRDLGMLYDGSSMRSNSRIADVSINLSIDVSINTVSNLLADAGDLDETASRLLEWIGAEVDAEAFLHERAFAEKREKGTSGAGGRR